ncbi:hypothetical protein HTVC026P_gp30 [Pelagibacter phage HTVC026P]|nr:hypothetical protein HTVC026P_gp30 [Pelagibacter phage HTVC026P]
MSDIVKDLTNYRIKGIEKAEVEFYESLTRTLDRIEDQIVSLVDRDLPRQAGKLIELQSAVAIRPKIKAILDKEYLPFADRVVRKGFGEQAKRVERQFKTIGIIPSEFQELTKGDLALVKNLKQQYYTQFKDVSNNFTRVLSDKVYQNTLVGTEFTVLEKELRESINGIYANSKDPTVNRLVNYVKRNQGNPALKDRVDIAVKQLQSKYARTRVGENMKRYAGQILNDSLRDFDATLNFNKSKDAGLTFVKYYGDVIPTTRDLCRRMVGGQLNKRKNGLFTIAEIQDIWASRSWSGKKGGNPMIVRGGYNCRHQFSYVNPDWYEDDGKESDILTTKQPTFKKEKGINISSFANPIAFANIRTVPIKESKVRLTKQIDKNKLDPRYPRNEDGSIKTRFKGTDKYAGKVTIQGATDRGLTTLTVLLDELNDLADKYNIPRLRGIRVSPSKRYSMAMGDGILYVDSSYLRRYTPDKLTKLKTVAWKYGDKQTNRPFGVTQYFDNELDKIRSVAYHEFGHHVHQMKYVNNDANYGYFKKTGFKAKVEERTKQLIRDERKKLPFDQRLIANSEYGDTNPQEFFAEQFSAYSMGKLDKVHPAFLKLIKELEEDVG